MLGLNFFQVSQVDGVPSPQLAPRCKEFCYISGESLTTVLDFIYRPTPKSTHVLLSAVWIVAAILSKKIICFSVLCNFGPIRRMKNTGFKIKKLLTFLCSFRNLKPLTECLAGNVVIFEKLI